MAAPHVAGAFALMRQLKPSASVSSVLNALNCGTGRQISRAGINRPRINVLAAGNELLTPDPVESFSFTAPGAVGWTKLLRPWSVSGGKFKSLDIKKWALASHPYCSSSFSVVARMLRYDPSPANQRWDYGIIVASSVMPFASDLLVSGYAFYVNKGAGAGNVVVRRLENYNLFDDLGASTQLCSGNKPTALKVFHTLRVDVTSPGFKFYVDGTLICSFIDFSFPPAAVLLAAHGPATGTGHHLLVDKVDIAPIITSSMSGPEASTPDFGPRLRLSATSAGAAVLQ
jgi:hypothetical protein